MPKFKTKNGVDVLFDNNELHQREGDEPFLVIDKDGNLIVINFDGYVIKPKEDKDSLRTRRKTKMKVQSIKELQESIEYELGDLQCLESCMEIGFNIHDWIQCKSDTLNFMRDRLTHLIEIERGRDNQ